MTNIVFGAGPIIRGFQPSDMYQFSLLAYQQTGATGGSTAALRDGIYTTPTGTAHNVFKTVLSDNPTYPGSSVVNLTPGVVANIAANQNATWVANGTASVQVNNPITGTQILNFTVTSTGTFNVFQRFSNTASGDATQSVSFDLSNLIDGFITARPTASLATTAIWSNLATNTANASAWFGTTLNLTSITREPSGGSGNINCLRALIGPHHILTAWHVQDIATLAIGWVGSNGVTYVGIVSNAAGSSVQIANTDIGIQYIGDPTNAQIIAYNAANPGSQAANTNPAVSGLSVGIAGGFIKPMALFPSTAYAGATACQIPLNQGVSATSLGYVPAFHTTQTTNIGVKDLTGYPHSIGYTDGNTYQNEFAFAPSTLTSRNPFGLLANIGYSESGDITFTAIPAGSIMATNNASLGAGYPIMLGCTHGSGDQVTFYAPWAATYNTGVGTSGITDAMRSTAQAAGDASYASYATITVSLTGYGTY